MQNYQRNLHSAFQFYILNSTFLLPFWSLPPLMLALLAEYEVLGVYLLYHFMIKEGYRKRLAVSCYKII
jgi:hypothetical protein